MKRKILVIGCGSIGERHIRCFQKTGRAEMAACDVSSQILERLKQQYGVGGYTDLDQALAAGPWDATVVCVPANLHIDFTIRCLKQGANVLIEKPLSISLDGIDRLNEAISSSGKFVRVGYTWHFWPGMKPVREFLRSGVLGRPLHGSVISGQHFPTFRPAYRQIYYTRHETGGGAIQDSITHNVNTMEWLLGPTTRVFCDAAHQALEGVTVEDTVCIVARNGSALVTYGHNQFQAPNETTFQINCERGSIKIEAHEQRWGVFRHGDAGWEYRPSILKERDDMFSAQANAFLDGLDGAATDLSTVSEALQTLRFNLAALESWKKGVPIEIQ